MYQRHESIRPSNLGREHWTNNVWKSTVLYLDLLFLFLFYLCFYILYLFTYLVYNIIICI